MQDTKYKYFTIIFAISVVSFLITLCLEGLSSAIVLLIGIAVMLFITKSIWNSQNSVKIASLTIASSVAMSYGFWQNFLNATIATYLPEIAEKYQYAPPLLIFIFIGVVIWIANYFNRDYTAMGKHPNSIKKALPNISYENEIKGIAESLSAGLRNIDIQTNWSSQYFTPLEAEVEVIKGTSRTKKIMDLLSAIKKSDDRLFLVLGDPGSGKSVSLRKLCQDLSDETKKTGKIPIYINLKEWQLDKKWDHDNPPTTEDLMNFVLTNLKERDIFISKFFSRKIDDQTYFERLYLTGHLFFVFDSFDEIPSVLNEDENSWLIKELSKVIFTFLKGARENSSQGILASRLFRKPTQEFQGTTTLEIRPFTEKKIIKTFERNGKIDSAIIKDFFKNRSHLIPIARNPFTATLISEYIEFNDGVLPKTHAELYENYLNQLLDNCKDQMRKRDISKEEIISFSKSIATSMYKSNQGWEIEMQRLRDINLHTEKYIDILKIARIGRGNTGNESVFSFVHRRFAEYFMAKNMIDNKDVIDLQAIPKDSQLRDALVLYCEIADEEAATKIADYCWDNIETMNNLQNIEVVHALRFLRDAFKSRKDCLRNFNTQLARYMKQQINYKNDMLSIKLIVECVSLLDNDNIEENILLALELDNYWITETAFYSCRNISYLSKEIMRKFEKFFNEMPIINLLQSYSDYKFSLSLSESFSYLLLWVKYRIFDFFVFSITSIIGLYMLFSVSNLYQKILFLIVIFLLPLAIKRFWNLFLRITIPMLFAINIFASLFPFSKINMSMNACLLLCFLFLCQIIYPIHRNRNFSLMIKHWRKILSSLIVMLVFFGIIQGLVYFLEKFIILRIIFCGIFGIIGLIILVGMLWNLIYSVVPEIKNYYYQNKLLKKIDFKSCNNREIIYKQFKGFDNNKVKLKYVSMLELYVHHVTGDWPDKDIFIITSNSANIRLAQLEEKWLGINR